MREHLAIFGTEKLTFLGVHLHRFGKGHDVNEAKRASSQYIDSMAWLGLSSSWNMESSGLGQIGPCVCLCVCVVVQRLGGQQ